MRQERSEFAREWRIALYKSDEQQQEGQKSRDSSYDPGEGVKPFTENRRRMERRRREEKREDDTEGEEEQTEEYQMWKR